LPRGAKVAERVKLTDRKLKALKPARTGERYEIMDTEVSGFGALLPTRAR
jgi:hypothetical protein